MKIRSFVSLIVIFVFLVTLSSGCGKDFNNDDNKTVESKLIFEGESLNWKGRVIQNSTEIWSKDQKDGKLNYDNSSNGVFTLEYKGDNPSLVGDFKYKYESDLKGGSGDATLDNSGMFSTRSGGKGVALLRDHHSFRVTVEWDDSEETFDLTVQK